MSEILEEQKTYPIVWTKRVFDVLMSAFILILISPIFIFILISIILEHLIREGHFVFPLYKDRRISQGEEFNLLKFNIFCYKKVARLQSNDVFINTKRLEWDGHTLYVGKILRQIYFDEIPQFINILKGDMSFVGPRPVNIEVYKERIANGDNVKPVLRAGLTGNFQSYKGVTKKSDLEMDREYLEYYRNHTPFEILWSDLKIIGRTIKVVLKAEGI